MGVTLPNEVAPWGADCLPKKNFTEPSGFSRASVASRAVLIGSRYLSFLASAGQATARDSASPMVEKRIDFIVLSSIET
jgi:hypothetical protein